MRFQDRVAMITGAAGGLGSTYARDLAAEGATIVAVDLASCKALVDELKATGTEVTAYQLDLANGDDVRTMVDDAVERFGRIDILVNNAGTGRVPRRPGLDDTIDLEQWHALMDINLTSAVHCSNFVAKGMRERRYGRIVNVSSRAARSIGWFSGVSTGYVCSKIAVIGLTRDLAARLGPDGITVNCIAPGFVLSGPAMEARWQSMSQAEQARMIAETPLRRMPRPDEISNVVLFLASNDSSYVTGVCIDVNGGSVMA